MLLYEQMGSYCSYSNRNILFHFNTIKNKKFLWNKTVLFIKGTFCSYMNKWDQIVPIVIGTFCSTSTQLRTKSSFGTKRSFSLKEHWEQRSPIYLKAIGVLGGGGGHIALNFIPPKHARASLSTLFGLCSPSPFYWTRCTWVPKGATTCSGHV